MPRCHQQVQFGGGWRCLFSCCGRQSIIFCHCRLAADGEGGRVPACPILMPSLPSPANTRRLLRHSAHGKQSNWGSVQWLNGIWENGGPVRTAVATELRSNLPNRVSHPHDFASLALAPWAGDRQARRGRTGDDQQRSGWGCSGCHQASTTASESLALLTADARWRPGGQGAGAGPLDLFGGQ